MKTDPARRFDIGEMLCLGVAGGAVGAAAATLPDMLEPAYHPHHRKFFHSFTAGSLALYGAYRAFDSEPSSLGKATALSAGAGYAAHLLSDSETAFGIPLLI